MEIFIIWVFVSIVVGAIGSEREIGFWRALIISLFLSPLFGLLFSFSSASLGTLKFQRSLLNELSKANETLESNIDITVRLERLEGLRTRNVISEDEFETLKAKELLY